MGPFGATTLRRHYNTSADTLASTHDLQHTTWPAICVVTKELTDRYISDTQKRQECAYAILYKSVSLSAARPGGGRGRGEKLLVESHRCMDSCADDDTLTLATHGARRGRPDTHTITHHTRADAGRTGR